jgi:hypothetical protein
VYLVLFKLPPIYIWLQDEHDSAVIWCLNRGCPFLLWPLLRFAMYHSQWTLVPKLVSHTRSRWNLVPRPARGTPLAIEMLSVFKVLLRPSYVLLFIYHFVSIPQSWSNGSYMYVINAVLWMIYTVLQDVSLRNFIPGTDRNVVLCL